MQYNFKCKLRRWFLTFEVETDVLKDRQIIAKIKIHFEIFIITQRWINIKIIC